MTTYEVPVSHLEAGEKTKRSGSFGGVADHYARHRPGPPAAAVTWFLPARVERVVDLGAGTGALTRQLTEKAEEIIAIEPDDRMRAFLAESLPHVRALSGKGEAIPLPDGCADAILASSSWHWMEVEATLAEVARVLKPGGRLGVIWSGPDGEGAFMSQAVALLSDRARSSEGGAGSLIANETLRPNPTLEIPEGSPFSVPEKKDFHFVMPLTADDLIGLLGTISWCITMPEVEREETFAEARRMLVEFLGIEGDVTVDVDFKAESWLSTSLA